MHIKWNQFYNEKGHFYLLPHPDFGNVIQLLQDKNAQSVLDLGCGSGRHLIELAEHNFLVTGIDYSPSAAQLAESWLEERSFHGKVYVGEFLQSLKAFKQDEFDAVIAADSLNYITDEKVLNKIFENINRVVKPNGLIFFVFPSELTLMFHPNVPQKFFEKEEIENILKDKFEIIQLYQDKNKSWVVTATNK